MHEYSLADGKWHNSTPIVLIETEQNLLMMSAQGYTTEEIAARLLTSSTLLWLGRASELTLLSLCAASRKLGVETIGSPLFASRRVPVIE